MTLHPIPLNFLIYEENFLFFFISVGLPRLSEQHWTVASFSIMASGRLARFLHTTCKIYVVNTFDDIVTPSL
jgi:hypothetical protein